jgi:hypothetical protein
MDFLSLPIEIWTRAIGSEDSHWMRKLMPVSMKIPSARVTWGLEPAPAIETAKTSRATPVVMSLHKLMFISGSHGLGFIAHFKRASNKSF